MQAGYSAQWVSGDWMGLVLPCQLILNILRRTIDLWPSNADHLTKHHHLCCLSCCRHVHKNLSLLLLSQDFVTHGQPLHTPSTVPQTSAIGVCWCSHWPNRNSCTILNQKSLRSYKTSRSSPDLAVRLWWAPVSYGSPGCKVPAMQQSWRRPSWDPCEICIWIIWVLAVLTTHLWASELHLAMADCMCSHK